MRRSTSSDDERRPEHPQKHANWLSMVTFFYTIPIFRRGRYKDMDESDLTKPLDEHKASLQGEKLAILWSQEVQKAKEHHDIPNLTKVIIKCYRKDIIIQGIILFIMEVMIRLFQPMFLGLLLRYFKSDNSENKIPLREPMYLMRVFKYGKPGQCAIQDDEAYLYAFGILFCNVVNVMVLHPSMMGITHVGMKLRVATCSLIYRKTLRLDLVALSGPTVGNVINLISNDVNRFDMIFICLHYIWIAPVQMILSLYFIYREVEISAVVGISAILVVIPLQAWFGNQTSIFRLKTAIKTDERVRQMNEILQGMQVIKMYTWEYAFAELINELRRSEIRVLKQTSYIRGTILSFIMFTTRLAIFLTILSYVVRGKSITAEKVFVVTSYYQILRQTMTLFFPTAIAQIAETNVAVSRIKKFLLMPESQVGDPTPLNPHWKKKPDAGTNLHTRKPDILSLNSVRSTSASFYSKKDDTDDTPKITISNSSVKIDNEVCLQNITLEILQGELVAVIGQVGSGKSVLLNLILGEVEPCVGKIRVKGVISYAAQEPWLFAGSVRQNILFGREYDRDRYRAVVRACALVRDFALLPFGDQTVVGEKGISLSGGQRARINLARAVYKKADIYLLDDPLSAVDTHVGKHLFDECVTGFLVDKIVILVTHQLQFLNEVGKIILMDEGSIAAQGSYEYLEASGLEFSEFLRNQLTDDTEAEADTKFKAILKDLTMRSSFTVNVIDIEGQKYAPQQEVGEMRSHGSVGCYVYKEYFKAGGNCCILLTMIDTEEIHHMPVQGNSSFPLWGDLSTNTSIIVYSVIIFLTIVVALTRSFVFFTVCMRASVNIIKASMKFFNNNTSGRILNRFSKDLGDVDEFLPNAMIDCTQIMLNLVGAIVVIAYVNYFLMIPTIIMCFCFYMLRKYYLHTSRSVKRLEGLCRSPVFAHLNATIQGLSTIRSNGAEMILTKEFDKYLDVHSSAWFMFIATARAFDDVGSRVGLAITQAIGLSGLFQWGMKQSAEMENQMTAVERILEFTRVEHEPDLQSTPDKKPPPEWPAEGKIEFQNLIMKYKENEPPVLKSLNLVIQPKEKIGIVGRTGAGKSSLIAALFRLAKFEGAIIVDGVNITEIGLHDLRKKISIIPQEPVLFSGSLRYNMDPFNNYDDATIVNALIVVEVKVAMLEGVGCLQHHVSEGGINISVGERQMICLARAVLRNNVILVLDEATANVDPKTDKFLQTTIRQKFANCTVLTIAHRLHTIMDSDRVAVMDAGVVVEFDHPHILLQNRSGFLSLMVEKTGKAMSQNLRNIAKNSYESKRGTSE
ncbi:ABC tran and/or MMR HSR1 domain containing protein [Asbolus verrucosus]|uniref:ABC tran and/or MMR HSR1 domain containing protein n=1 Tax=Asbolus verrucosus TaxID=1661398 RepID=A0A482VDH9_ASBVE|nr:ABC tran and/or MMR HSR1 domain containing protein [Asbolus verrucosus]